MERIAELMGLGRAAAADHFPKVRDQFQVGSATSYVPYPDTSAAREGQ